MEHLVLCKNYGDSILRLLLVSFDEAVRSELFRVITDR